VLEADLKMKLIDEKMFFLHRLILFFNVTGEIPIWVCLQTTLLFFNNFTVYICDLQYDVKGNSENEIVTTVKQTNISIISHSFCDKNNKIYLFNKSLMQYNFINYNPLCTFISKLVHANIF
jgi:hypothetical protein